jgi:hypothetical protein
MELVGLFLLPTNPSRLSLSVFCVFVPIVVEHSFRLCFQALIQFLYNLTTDSHTLNATTSVWQGKGDFNNFYAFEWIVHLPPFTSGEEDVFLDTNPDIYSYGIDGDFPFVLQAQDFTPTHGGNWK